MLKSVNDFKFNSKFRVIINYKDNIFWIQTLEGKDNLPQCKKEIFLYYVTSISTLMKTHENVGNIIRKRATCVRLLLVLHCFCGVCSSNLCSGETQPSCTGNHLLPEFVCTVVKHENQLSVIFFCSVFIA